MRRHGITLAAVLLAVANNVAACVLYVEIPDPYTKEDYVAAIKGRDPSVKVLEVVNAETLRQMEVLANPSADYIVHVTKNGEVIRPDWEEITNKGIRGPKTTFDRTYVRGNGWDADHAT